MRTADAQKTAPAQNLLGPKQTEAGLIGPPGLSVISPAAEENSTEKESAVAPVREALRKNGSATFLSVKVSGKVVIKNLFEFWISKII